MGVILSIIVLISLSAILKTKEGRVPNRFKYWALIGLIGVPISLAPFLGGAPNNTAGQSPSSPPPTIATNQIIPLGTEQQVLPDRAISVSGSNTFSSISVSNPLMEPIQAEGGQLVGVYINIRNTGSQSGNMFWSGFQLKDAQGRTYDKLQDFAELVTLTTWSKEQGLTDAGDQLFPGASVRTVMVFRVSPDAQGLKLVANGNKEFSIY